MFLLTLKIKYANVFNDYIYAYCKKKGGIVSTQFSSSLTTKVFKKSIKYRSKILDVADIVGVPVTELTETYLYLLLNLVLRALRSMVEAKGSKKSSEY